MSVKTVKVSGIRLNNLEAVADRVSALLRGGRTKEDLVESCGMHEGVVGAFWCIYCGEDVPAAGPRLVRDRSVRVRPGESGRS